MLETAKTFLVVWLAHPVVALPVLLSFGILFGLGKPLGVPRLFWSTRFWEQAWAGLSVALVFFEAVLVDTLLFGFEAAKPAEVFALASSGVGATVVIIAAVRAHRTRERAPGRVTPKIWKAGPQPDLVTRPWGFLLGFLLAAVLVAALSVLAFLVVPPALRTTLLRLLPAGAERLPELHLVAFTGAAAFGLAFVFPRKRVPAAVALCALLGVVIAVHGLVRFWGIPQGVEALVVLGGLVGSGVLRRRRLHIHDLARHYAAPAPYPPEREAHGLLDELAPLQALAARGSRKLVVVCASGGGIRAATWTAAVLSELDRRDGFRAATRWISGASGGMVGAAFWRAAARRDRIPETVARDSLTPAFRQLVFNDVPLAFLPVRNAADRGQALQDAWCRNLAPAGALDAPVSALREGERTGAWPSLVFSPMLVEDGRRLLISNLDLRAATDQLARWLSSSDQPHSPTYGLASKTAYSLDALLPGALGQMTLATAARLSASFPFVSPAVPLPTRPSRRVVDAGYYDNYGVDLACGWLRSLLEYHREELRSAVDAILVIQVRDNVSDLSINPTDPAEYAKLRRRASEKSALLRGFEGLTSPLEAVFSARDSSMLFRNDGLLEAVTQLYRNSFEDPDFLTTTVFDFRGEVSLSWRLDGDERELLMAQVLSDGIQQKIAGVEAWLLRSSPPE